MPAQSGGACPHAAWPLGEHSAVYALPPNSGTLDGTLSIRAWKAALFSNDSAALGGLQGAPLIGQRQVTRSHRPPSRSSCIRSKTHVSFANAGHLPPSLDGDELSVAGSLPLGLVEGAAYDSDQCWLHEGQCLTFYTDGVLEARSDQGELFGFDRVADLLAWRPRMQQIIDEVVAFGQEDDIAVLSLTRLASPELSRMSTHTQVDHLAL